MKEGIKSLSIVEIENLITQRLTEGWYIDDYEVSDYTLGKSLFPPKDHIKSTWKVKRFYEYKPKHFVPCYIIGDDEWKYSYMFKTIYNEETSTDDIGRGTHYSILEIPTDYSEGKIKLPNNVEGIHRVALIWDEDHDLRIIPILNRFYGFNWMESVLFIGERKGNLSIVLSRKVNAEGSWIDVKKFTEKVVRCCNNVSGDCWNVDISILGDEELTHIINDKTDNVKNYLKNIYTKWNLGVSVKGNI